jgi:hypothetical protein
MQDPILQPVVEEVTIPTKNENVREEESRSWHEEVGAQRVTNWSTTYTFWWSRKHMKLVCLTKEAMLGINQERTSCNVRLGSLMEHPGAVLYSHPVNLHDSWKLFHQLKQFNWLVLEQMPPGWMPKCGSCGHFTDMRKHGMTSCPRLIYGAFDNYILNWQERFYCRGCARLWKISGLVECL